MTYQEHKVKNKIRLLAVIFSLVGSSYTFAEALPPAHLNERRVMVTGHINVHAHRSSREIMFTDENGQFIKMTATELAGIQAARLAKNGRVHVTLTGVLRDDLFYAGLVEPYLEDVQARENTLGVRRFDAIRAIETIVNSILANRDWARHMNVPPEPFGRQFGNLGFSNGVYPRHLGDWAQTIVARENDEEFLKSMIAVGEIARRGIAVPQIEHFENAMRKLLDIAEPDDMKRYKALLKNQRCEGLLSPSEKQVAYQNVVRNLEAQLRQ